MHLVCENRRHEVLENDDCRDDDAGQQDDQGDGGFSKLLGDAYLVLTDVVSCQCRCTETYAQWKHENEADQLKHYDLRGELINSELS